MVATEAGHAAAHRWYYNLGAQAGARMTLTQHGDFAETPQSVDVVHTY